MIPVKKAGDGGNEQDLSGDLFGKGDLFPAKSGVVIPGFKRVSKGKINAEWAIFLVFCANFGIKIR